MRIVVYENHDDAMEGFRKELGCSRRETMHHIHGRINDDSMGEKEHYQIRLYSDTLADMIRGAGIKFKEITPKDVVRYASKEGLKKFQELAEAYF